MEEADFQLFDSDGNLIHEGTSYIVVRSNDLNIFEMTISNNMKEGWVCQGGVSVYHYGKTTFYQAMVKSGD